MWTDERKQEFLKILRDEEFSLDQVESFFFSDKGYSQFIELLNFLSVESDLDSDVLSELFLWYFGEEDIDLIAFRLCGKFLFRHNIRKWFCETFSVGFSQTVRAFLDYIRTMSEAHSVHLALENSFELACPLTGPIAQTLNNLLIATGQKASEIDWLDLKEEASQYFELGSEMLEYLHHMIQNYAETAPEPKWVSHEKIEAFDYEEPVLEERDFLKFFEVFSEVADKESIFYLLRFQPYPEEAQERRIDRYYGPMNPIFGSECSSGKGRCRMLSCCCHLDGVAQTEGDPGWFSGYCQNCHRGISHFSHAIRYPFLNGGFGEGYCSDKCLVTYISRLDQERGNVQPSEDLKTDLKRISCLVKVLNELTIHSRKF